MLPATLLIGELDRAKSTIIDCAKAKELKVMLTPDVNSAIATLTNHNIEMIFVDSAINLAELFEQMREAKLSIPVVVAGSSTPASNGAKAIRLGAVEYLSTPLNKTMVSKLLENISPKLEEDFIAADPKTIELMEQAKRFAMSDATVLLRGESGVGKEVYSKIIHQNSSRNTKPLISVNCAAIPENLLESELFGHEKGAFSGAINKRLGKFQLADKGTLLLDEISEMDMALQAKLLRAIQERVIDPVGSSEPVSVDIRLIATTNRDLEESVAKGEFREDLYFRLNVVSLEIPPLRERIGDINVLANYFGTIYAKQNKMGNITISPKAMKKLTSCYWKGNVRELENTIHRAVLMMVAESTMKPEHIVISPMSTKMMEEVIPKEEVKTSVAAGAYAAASGMFEGGTGGGYKQQAMVGRTVQDVEKDLILSTMDYCKGNRAHAADILGISILTLRDKLNEYQAIK